MRKYNPNPKHESPGSRGRKGTPLDLSPFEASELLNDPFYCLEVPGKRQFVAVKSEKIYVFQDDGAGAFHAYPTTGNEVSAKYSAIAPQIAALLQISVKRLSRLRE